MNAYISIIANDLKNTRRDPTLLLLFWVPLLMLAMVRYGLPALASYLPVIAIYYIEIIGFFVLLNAIFPGFILAFILLDEKDLQLLPVIAVTPVSLSGFLIARIVFMLVFGFLGSLLLFVLNGIVNFPLRQILSISLLCALNAPIMILLIASIAKNKVEGLTLLKVTNVTLFIPAAVFFLNTPWENVLAIFPAFWVYKYMDNPHYPNLIFILGIAALALMNYCCFLFANKKLR